MQPSQGLKVESHQAIRVVVPIRKRFTRFELLVDDGVCGLLIAEKLGVSQPTVTGHMKLLVDIGAVRAKRIKQWTFYKRDEERIRALKAGIVDEV